MQTSVKEKDDGSLEDRVLADLKAGLSWSKIAAKHHVSAKTINKIKKAAGFASEGAQTKAIFDAFMNHFEELACLLQMNTLNNINLTKNQNMSPIALSEITNVQMKLYKELFEASPNYAKELVDRQHPFDYLFEDAWAENDQKELKSKDRWLKIMSKYYPEDIARLYSEEEEE